MFRATSRDRIDWQDVRDSIDLRDVIRGELGEPPGRNGSRGRDWWQCPFHDDRNPSFAIMPGGKRWRCFGCLAEGDAVELVKRLHNVAFPEAVAILTGSGSRCAAATPPAPRPPSRPPRKNVLTPEGAAALADDAARRLWMTEGAAGLAYLTARGLTPETIRAAGLGWVPEGNPAVPWRPPGIVVPWRDNGRVVMLNVRPDAAWCDSLPPDRPRPEKYIRAYYRHPEAEPRLYPGPEVIRRGVPVVVAEGELDALLLGQELDGRAAVVTLGSATMGRDRDGIKPDIRGILGPAPVWWIATDADEAGDKAAAAWLAFPRAKRSRPPAGAKDWGELHEGGPNRIRYYWMPVLGWGPPAWEELQAQRWGPGLTDATEAIETDRPARTTEEIQAILDAIQADPEYRDERAAIQFEGQPCEP